MTRYSIGASGRAHLQVPAVHPLAASSGTFDFIEVNSDFSEIPSLNPVESWRRMAPPDFEFAVRSNKTLMHA